MDNDPGIEIVLLGRSSVAEGVFIYIASKQEVPKMYANELRTIVKKEMGSKDLDVYVICLNGQWLSKSDLLE